MSSVNSAPIDGLIDIYSNMRNDDEYLMGSVFGRLYTKSNTLKDATGFCERSEVADAKKTVYRKLKQYVGRKAADSIFRTENIKFFNDNNPFKPNGQQITKSQLGNILQAAEDVKLKQTCKTMLYKEREALLQNGKHSSQRFRLPTDPTFRRLFEMQALGQNSWETLHFLRSYEKFAQDLEALDAMRAGSRRYERETQRLARIALQLTSMTLNISSPLKDRLGGLRRQYLGSPDGSPTGQQIQTAAETMTRNDLLNVDAVLQNIPEDLQGVLNDVSKNVNAEIRGGQRYFNVNHQNPLVALRRLKASMTADDHVRLVGDTVYAKPNHHGGWFGSFWNRSKPHWWGGKRSEKFKVAKEFVRDRLLDYYTINHTAFSPKSVVKEIMDDYMENNRALTKQDLDSILLHVEL